MRDPFLARQALLDYWGQQRGSEFDDLIEEFAIAVQEAERTVPHGVPLRTDVS